VQRSYPQAPGLFDSRKRSEDLRRDFLVQLHVLVELSDQRPAHGLDLGDVSASPGGRGLGNVMAAHIIDALDPGALAAFHQHLDGAVGEFEHLQNVRNAADLVQVLAVGSSLAADFCATSRMLLPVPWRFPSP